MNKLIIAGGVALGLIALYGLKKKTEFGTVMESLDILVNDVKNVRLNGINTVFDVDLKVVNNSPASFSINTGGMATISKIRLLNNAGNEVGKSNLNMSDFNLPAKDSVLLKNIPIEITAMSIVGELGNLVNFNKSNYKIEVTITALGNTYIIEQGLV